MKYTYEMSREVKAMLKGDMDAFYHFYVMTVNDVYFHVKLVVKGEEETERVLISLYRSFYVKMGELSRPEDTITWMNKIIYKRLTEWVVVNCTNMMLEEDEGKYDDLRFDDEYIYSENMLTEAETANLAGNFIPEISPLHAVTALAYFYDSIPINEISDLLDCDEVRINTRTRYARKYVENECMSYARERILDIKKIDVHLLLLAYVNLAKTYGIKDIVGLYEKIVLAIS